MRPHDEISLGQIIYFGGFFCLLWLTKKLYWAVVVAELVERSLPIPQVLSSNPVIGKQLY